jgi:peptidoglycan/xylan/chitin deacetylase (PgdA/CDA1 family)
MVPVLTFHAVDDADDVVAFPPRAFETGLVAMRDAGIRVLTLSDLVSRLRKRESLPRRAAAITFDDGYRSVYEVALPMLERLAMPATVFVPAQTGESPGAERLPSQEGRERVSWPEMREMCGRGIEFGAHTMSHPDLTRLDRPSAEREIVGSREILEQGLGRPVTVFAYPFGRHDPTSREIVSETFEAAFSASLNLVKSGDDLFTLPRVEMYYFRSPRTFRFLLDRRLPFYLAARRLPRWVRGMARR